MLPLWMTDGLARIRPLAGDQAAVPGQQRAWHDEPVSAQPGWQRPGRRRHRRAVGPVGLGSRDLAPQHRHLVPEHHDLGVLGRLSAAGWWSYPSRLTDRVPAQYLNPLA
jgi:hypothetical protein